MTTDLRKKFWRVKQKADQNLGRAEKSEVLTDELQDLEKWVDQVKAQCHGTSKLIQRGLQTSASTEREKKLKKLSEYQLSAQLMEASGQLMQLRESTLMGQLMHTCGEAQERLAGECMEYERRVETEVLAPLNQLCDQDIPQIQKSKKNLCKMVLDMDTLKSRYAAAQKQYSAGNLPASKVEAARDELEDAQGKVHAAIDQLSTDLYKFTASEQEYSKFLLNLAKAQADYHRKALSILEGILPRMHEDLSANKQVPAFGTCLEEHLRRTGREIASVIEECIITLWAFGRDEEGLFRIAGAASKVKKLKAAFDAGLVEMEDFLTDIHCVAGALKLYLRELPEPLMTFDLYDEWMAAAHLGHEERMLQLWLLCDKLPKPFANNLRYLIKFLAKLSENSEVNKMSPSNIAIVIAPNLIWPKGDSGPSVLSTTTQSGIVESLIQHADYFFPGEVSFSFTDLRENTPSPRLKRQKSPGTLAQPKTPIKSGVTEDVVASVTNVLTAPINCDVVLRSPTLRRRKDVTNTSQDKLFKSFLNLSPLLSRKGDFMERKELPHKPKAVGKIDSTQNRPNLNKVNHNNTTLKVPKPEILMKPYDPDLHLPYADMAEYKIINSPSQSSDVRNFELELINSNNHSCAISNQVAGGTKSYENTGKEDVPFKEKLMHELNPSIPYSSRTTNAPPLIVTKPPRPPVDASKSPQKPSTQQVVTSVVTSSVTPPRSVHSDVYDTVFALQSLGGSGWGDYLTRVRSLLDSHASDSSNELSIASKRLSFGGLQANALNFGEHPISSKDGTVSMPVRASSESRLVEPNVEDQAFLKVQSDPKVDMYRQKQDTTVTPRKSDGHIGINRNSLMSANIKGSSSTQIVPVFPSGQANKEAALKEDRSVLAKTIMADHSTDIEFDCGGPSSEKGTPPGTLSAPPAGLYQNLDDLSTAAAPSLSPSASDHNFNTNDSPRTLRKNKRAAPAPPGIKPTRATVPTPLSTADTRPAVNEKPSHLLQSQKSAGLAPGERSPHGPDRPSAPPPAPPKGIGFSPGPPAHSVSYDATQGTHDPMAQAGAVHNQLQGSSKPSIPCSPKPTSAASRFSHDVTPSGVKPDEAPAHFEAGLPSQGATHSAAYDNMGSLTYGTKPAVISDSDQSRPMACNTPSSPNTGAVFSTTNSTHTSTTGAGPSSVNTQVGPDVSAINDKHEKSNSLPRTLPKPPRPPRPVTMIGKEGSDIISGSGGERKPSATEDTRL